VVEKMVPANADDVARARAAAAARIER